MFDFGLSALPLNLDWSDPEVGGNWVESAVWETLAVITWVRSRGPATPLNRLGRRAAAILVPFGISDLVESQTGAWWTPWWLLVWKGLGVLGLLWCFWTLVKLKRVEAAQAADPRNGLE